MQSLRILVRRNAHQLRRLHKCVSQCQAEAAVASSPVTEKLTIPVPEGVDKPVSPKIDKIAQDITALNLLEVSELSDLLKKRLNLPDAPIMPMGGFSMSPPKEDDEDKPKEAIKTSFTVKLMKFDDKQKVAIIKEIKNLIPGTNLVQAKKFVESAPQVVKADISKDEADQLKQTLNKVGGEVVIE
ncbi:39S ribosomal protein L12, mitochondrial [Copidosoma floridanum]|uniref:39S ribosomal protein L12, mitochondrial n=1 Tax=Copidosoma floridanum TaxID=29053 RepID=UPI0006C94966|nr:39S ribosomal protein L12, mitochondrial [Copidosoma floridanum]